MSSPATAAFALTYRVCPQHPQGHLFAVELVIDDPSAGLLQLTMPAWCPGSYMIRDFARNLLHLVAEDGQGRPLALIKRDKQTWEIATGDTPTVPLIVRYQVYAWDFTVRSAHLDCTHAYFNGPSLLLAVTGLADRPCRIELRPPVGDTYRDWRVATSLRPLTAEPLGFGAYQADDYADLIDHPVEMGRFDLVSFTVRSVPHRFAISGRARCDHARLSQDLVRLCEQHAALFGELPLDRYLFLTAAVADGYGGLEHRFSSSLVCTRDDLPRPGVAAETAPTAGYRRLLGLCSHEYFHLWHVTRIRPQALMAGDLSREVHTRLLWAFEGITSYYDELALVRAGCIDTPAYLQLLAETVTRVMRTPGRLVQTLAESSFDAWTKFYRQDENGPNAVVSYYAKGALVALALDLTLRQATAGRVSLDDVMRALWERHGRTGVGVPERGVEAIAAQASGLDLDAFFAQALDSPDDLDLASLLATVGIQMRLRPATGPKDLGGAVERFAPVAAGPTLALRLRAGTTDAVIQTVLSGGAGESAGLAPGDQVLAVDGLRATAENLERLVAAAGEPVRLHLFRRDELLELEASPHPAAADTCELMLLDPAPPDAAQGRAAWLASLA
ncbi:M61 family metallopeptidase [uncultured Thiodictyon sp.]|uniref:M61 family metallopeptidase n=1 Tax=uncultured Thiodictyon sp. TaxID=1846217 RepID=UPI0025D97B91|nr:PDZ domain-containing protein [uncultured Thiodictyon sp.]